MDTEQAPPAPTIGIKIGSIFGLVVLLGGWWQTYEMGGIIFQSLGALSWGLVGAEPDQGAGYGETFGLFAGAVVGLIGFLYIATHIRKGY